MPKALKTWLDGLVTSHGMQEDPILPCLLGCRDQKDTLMHYIMCPPHVCISLCSHEPSHASMWQKILYWNTCWYIKACSSIRHARMFKQQAATNCCQDWRRRQTVMSKIAGDKLLSCLFRRQGLSCRSVTESSYRSAEIDKR